MHFIPIDEAGGVLERLEALLREAGEVTLARHGVPVARVVPLREARPVPSRRALREAMPRLDPPSEALIREDREGR